MNRYDLHTDLVFTFRFVQTTLAQVAGTTNFLQVVTGITGLTPTVTVYSPAGVVLANGQAATEFVSGTYKTGVYKYTLAAGSVISEGCYRAVATTTSTGVDCQSVADFVLVEDGFSESATGTGILNNTLAGIVRMLRIRLNDLDIGNYTAEEMQYCVNLAYRETLTSARCYLPTESVALVADTSEYATGNIFEPVNVYLGSTMLGKIAMGDVGLSEYNWTTDPSGTPLKWIPLGGGNIRLHPAPSASAVAATPSLTIHGYGYADPLTQSTDVPVGLPEAYALQLILDKAEAEARKMRSTDAGNVALVPLLMDNWKNWCNKLAQAIGGSK
jgi:hypothetical protein